MIKLIFTSGFLTINFIQFAKSKALKLLPIIKEWKFYNSFCNSIDSRFSLFYLKKKAFKSFNKESRQDLYSSKILLDKVFDLNLSEDKEAFPFYSHLVFCSDLYSEQVIVKSSFCIHCGLGANSLF